MKIVKEVNLEKYGINIIVQEDKGVIDVKVSNTNDINLYLNEELIYEDTKEELKDIPVQIRNTIKPYMYEYGSNVRVDGKEISVDMLIVGDEYVLATKSITTKKTKVKLYNWLMDYDKMEDYIDIDVEKEKQRLDILENKIKELGFGFYCSHDGEEYDNSYYLETTIGEFDMSKILKACELWSEYNEEMRNLLP